MIQRRYHHPAFTSRALLLPGGFLQMGDGIRLGLLLTPSLPSLPRSLGASSSRSLAVSHSFLAYLVVTTRTTIPERVRKDF